MEGAFERGTILWYWYDAWVVIPALAVAAVVTAWALLRASWSNPIVLVVKLLGILGTVLVALVALDRIGINIAVQDAQTFGYASVVGAIGTIVLGLLVVLFGRGKASQEAAGPVGQGTTMAGGATTAMGAATAMGTATAMGAATGGFAPAAAPKGADMTVMAESEEATLLASGDEKEAPASEGAPTMVVGGAAAPRDAGGEATVMAAAPTARLVGRKGPEAGQTFPLTEQATTIGRSSESTIVLQDPTVSRRHARVLREGTGYVLEDAGSTSGTLLNGAKVQRERLRSGSVLRLGETELTFQMEGAVEEAQPTRMGAAPAAAAAASAASGATVMLSAEKKAAAWLLARSGAAAGRSFDLQGERVAIGRAPESLVHLDDTAVSREHAVVYVREGRYILYDVGSRSGTKVNGEALAGYPLKDGSRISLGASELLFTSVTGGAPSAPAPSGSQTVILRATAASHGVLMARSGPAAGRSFSLGEEDLVIGREPGPGGAQLDDSAISRRHVLVRRAAEGYMVYDLGSANGTSVDGTALTGREIHNGDVIQVGQTELQFVQAQSA